MDADTNILIATAFSVGLVHTLLGPDHYVPFVAMSKSHGWTVRKTMLITAACGLGHVGSSAIIGLVGLLLGTAIFQIEALESLRGEGAAWLLIGFGLAYFAWGIVRAIRGVPHTHRHAEIGASSHSHEHEHDHEHDLVQVSVTAGEHGQPTLAQCDHRAIASGSIASGSISNGSATPWLLFLIFVFGPCEVLIPLLMYPAAQAKGWAVLWVLVAFTLATIMAMTAAVAIWIYSLGFVRLPDLHRYAHALAGLAVLMCGMMVKLGC